MFNKPTFFLLCSVLAGALPLQGAQVSVKGGVTKTPIPVGGGNTVTITFRNDTEKDIYDLELSTQESSGIDPDFQGGPVLIKVGGVLKDWVTDQAPADGVEDIRAKVRNVDSKNPPDPAEAIKKGQVFTVTFTSDDGFAAGDQLTLQPSTIRSIAAGHMGVPILAGSGQAHNAQKSHSFFNGFDGLQGENEGCWSGTNGLAVPLEHLIIESPSVGVEVVIADSSHPHMWDPINKVLRFMPPIAPGADFDYYFVLNQTEPFLEFDPDPYTTVNVVLNPPGRLILTVVGLIAGNVAQFTAWHSHPSHMVGFAYSLKGAGPTTLANDPCKGLMVSLSQPITIMAVVPADASGNAWLNIAIPPIAAGVPVWVQAVDIVTCDKSNLLAEVIL